MIKIREIKKYLKELPKTFYSFDIKYTQKELDYLNNFIILKDSEFSYHGDISNLNNKLNDFIKEINNNKPSNIFSNIIYKLLDNITRAYNKKYFWILIRITLPSNEYDIPRWHKDHTFFTDCYKSGNYKNESKFVTVLKGPGTLFTDNSKINNIYDLIEKKETLEREKKRRLELEPNYDLIVNKYRKILVSKLQNIKHNQLEPNKGLIFTVGSAKNDDEEFFDGLLHSEPKLDSSRIFISILPGLKSEINNHKKRVYEKYYKNKN